MEHRVDAHHHLWDLTTRPLPWIDPVDMAVIDRSFGVADLAEVAPAAHVDRTVVVEAAWRSGSLATAGRAVEVSSLTGSSRTSRGSRTASSPSTSWPRSR